MKSLLAASIGLMAIGPLGALVCALLPPLWSLLRPRRVPPPPVRVVLLLLLVTLRSGSSVLAALIEVSDMLPDHQNLRTVARVARVSGLMSAIPRAGDDLRPVIAQLARAQRSGASLSEAVRRMVESELSAERARRIARARTLPVQLMIPVTLLMLPGLVLLLYAPALLTMFQDLTGVLR